MRDNSKISFLKFSGFLLITFLLFSGVNVLAKNINLGVTGDNILLNGSVGVGTTAPSDLLTVDSGISRKGITIKSDGAVDAFSDFQFAQKTAPAAGNVFIWDISHRKDGYFSGSTSGSLEFYGVKQGGGYYAPLSFKNNGDVILVSPKGATTANVGIGTTNPLVKLDIKGKTQIDTSGTYSAVYSWAGGALQTNSVEIMDRYNGSTGDGAYPTLTFHDYGNGGAQFSMEGLTTTLHLGSGQSSSAGTLGVAGGYFSKLKIWGALETTGAINVGGSKINNLGIPVVASDAVTKGYVDSAVTSGNADTLDGLHSTTFQQRVSYSTGAGNSGYYKINILPATSWMLSFTIRLYQGYRYDDVRISGYNYGGNYWYSPLADLLNSSATSIDVQFGYDSAYNLWVAVPAAAYTGLEIIDITNGYTQVNQDWSKNFSIVNQSSLTGTVQTTQTVYRPLKYNENAVSATTATNANAVGGLAVHAGTNNEANKIVRTDGSGYLFTGYINSGSGNEGNNSSPARVWGTNGSDSYLRTYLTSALSVNYANIAGSISNFSVAHAVNPDTKGTTGIHYFAGGATSPYSDGTLIQQAYQSAPTTWGSQIMQDYRTGKLAVRGLNNTNWTTWLNIIDSGNIGAQSVNYATNAGNADTVDGHHFNWSGQGGQPTWLWGGNDPTNMYVYNPSNFSVNYAGSAGSATSAGSSGYSNYLSTNYIGGQQLNPQTYFNNGIGLKVAMTGSLGYWFDTVWINGYAGGDVPNMIALHTSRNGEARMWLSSQPSTGTSFGTSYEFITTRNIAAQTVSNVSSLAGTWSGLNYFLTNNGGYAVNNSNSAALEAYSSGNNSAYMSFHRGGYYAVNFGLDQDNVMRIGGWSAPANLWQLDMGGNQTILGGMWATAYTYSSDQNLKKNIATIQSPLEKILQLRGVTFDWKKDGKSSVGLIAQEVEKVFPELVTGEEGKKGVQYGNLVAPLIEAVKAQQKEIETLNNRIKILEIKNKK